jgi:serine/threonine protein kinase
VQEYFEGGDLHHYLKTLRIPISESRACEIIYSVASAVAFLHSYGIVHRDIKPSNILLVDTSPSSFLKLTDIGGSKILAQ